MTSGVASIAWGNACNSKQLLEIYVRAFCSLVVMPLGRSLWVESDTKMSHDEAAGTQRHQNVA